MSDTTLFGTAEGASAFSDGARLQGMLDFEAALARAQGRLGVIPEAAAPAIAARAKAGAVSTRSATGAGVRLGRPGRGRQVLLGDLPGRAVAEAAARGAVEPAREPAEVGPRERLGRALARQEATGAAVQVLDATFLPAAVRVAEV